MPSIVNGESVEATVIASFTGTPGFAVEVFGRRLTVIVLFVRITIRDGHRPLVLSFGVVNFERNVVPSVESGMFVWPVEKLNSTSS